MQILVEAVRRPTLHRFLAPWNEWLAHTASGVRWALDVDPQQI
jgi:primosomal protein N'